MGERMTAPDQPPRGKAATSLWSADCKDCRSERAAWEKRRQTQSGRGKGSRSAVEFEYSGGWAARKLERGESRSDRCERHRRDHVAKIRAIAVPYVDLRVIGEVADPARPSGPLGGLGPLPVLHRERPRESDLADKPFGMADADILALLEGLKDKKVAIVEAGTGTGKSTFMPFRLMNPPEGAAWRPTDLGPIVVTEPRRAAATEVARFVGEALCYGCDPRTCAAHIGPGFQVGYQVRGEQHWDAACELLYVTDGTMINWVREGRLARYSLVIIDEAHERNENIDIILAQLRELIGQHDHLRIIIASATLDRDFFLSYFGGPEKVFQLQIPATKSFGYGTPFFVGTEIDETVLGDGLAFGPGLTFPGWPTGPSDPQHGGEDLRKLSRTLAKLRCVGEIHEEKWRQDMPDAVADQVLAIARETGWGDILAFLPTSNIIQRTVERIRRGLDDAGLDLDVYPLLSTTPKAISDKAIAARKRGDRRRIVISSNLAETSLTVEGMRFVVDSGLICQEEWDSKLASGDFPVKGHSQSALRQRWGRVGRDMPGWVFPLYTVEQFLALPRNTSPETSRKSLESHHMKLLASGLDPETAILPGDHLAGDAGLDQAGRDAIDQFRRESRRARDALALAGIVDADGHLTEFGRDIERASGDGAGALAVMLADQLACAHEVILALQVLGEGQLVGNRREGVRNDYILAVDERWPAAWRVRAAQAHRGLALGCRDELDILLRVVALYQQSSDPAAWCARWWVNAAMIEDVLEKMMAQVDTLSAAMKEEAWRAIDPALAGRARAVLSRALVSARFRKADADHYLAEQGEHETATLAPNRVVAAPPDRLLALQRSRPGRARDGAAPPAKLSHLVEYLPWAALNEAGADEPGLDLILRVAAHGGKCGDVNQKRALAVLEALPVGALVELELGGGGLIQSHRIVAEPMAGRAAQASAPTAGRERARSGFDRDWDPRGNRLGELPEDERARKVLKSVPDEANDAHEPAPPAPAATEAKPAELGPLTCRTSAGALPPAGTVRSIIAGYDEAANGAITILVDQVAPDLAVAEPGLHPDVIAWEEVDVMIGQLIADHDMSFLQLDRADLRGSFFLGEWRAGPNRADTGFIERLKTGARIKARALPTPEGGMTATLLPLAREILAQAPVETRPWKDGRVRVYAGTIVEEPDASGWAGLELEQKDKQSGMSFRFRASRRDLERFGLSAPFAGARLFAALQPGRDSAEKEEARQGARTTRLVAPGEAVASDASKLAGLEVNGRRIRAGPRDISFATIAALLEACPDSAWRQGVWAFYEQHLHLSVPTLYPDSVLVELPVRVAALLAFQKAEFEARLGVTLYLRRGEAAVGLAAPDKSREANAVKALQALGKLPRLSVDIGRARVSWRAATRLPDIDYTSIDGGVLTIFGRTERAVEAAMRDILKPARGEIAIPPHLIKVFIGTGGMHINRFRAASGCEARSPANDGRYIIEGPSAGAIERFLELAKDHIRGAVGHVTDRGTIVPLPDPRRPSPSGPIAAWRSENPDFFADVGLADLERLAGAKSQLRAVPEQKPPRNASGPGPAIRRPQPANKVKTGGFLAWLSKLFD